MKTAMDKENKDTQNAKETEDMTMKQDASAQKEDLKKQEDDIASTEENMDEVIEETVEEEEAAAQKTEKKSLFKNNKSKEIAAKDQKIEELNDRLMRNMAEFDNFRKRSEKEKSQMFDMGAKTVIEKILPIIDNFERGLDAVSEKEKDSAFAQGIEMIYKQLLTSLDEIGVKPIEAVGKEFDPALHNAVMHGEDDSMEANIVSDEFQKGYLYRDIVVRHSMVKVVN